MPRPPRVHGYHLCFALGKALEDLRRYEESFAFYARGNALSVLRAAINRSWIELNTRMQIEVCTPALFFLVATAVLLLGSYLHSRAAALRVRTCWSRFGVSLSS